MHIILGGTGRVGSVVSKQLLEQGEPVTIISRNPGKARPLSDKGATIAIIDVCDTASLRKCFQKADRLFLLNPPADPSANTVEEEKKTLHAILKALPGTGISTVVAQSTYGARPGDNEGDLNVLFEMEQSLSKMNIQVTIIRAAYYMSNWDGYLELVKKEGRLPSFYPADFLLPMVAPADLGKTAARFLTEPPPGNSIHYVEGPRTYSPRDVARAFASSLGKSVEVIEIPESQWEETFKHSGFSDEAAASYAAMTRVVLENNYDQPADPVRGETTIEDYINNLVQQMPA